MELRYFDVKDLVDGLHVHVPPATLDPQFERAHEEPVPFVREESLVDLIRETLGQHDQWEDPATIEVRNRILIVRNTPAIVDTVALFLAGLRSSRSVVALDVEHVELDAATGERVLGDAAVFVLDEAAKAAIEAAVAEGKASRLSRERVLSVEGAGAQRRSGREIPFVTGYGLESDPHEKRVEKLLDGTRVDVRAIGGYAGDRAHLELRYGRDAVFGKGTHKSPHGPIDLPQREVWSVATGLSVPYGRAAVVFASRSEGVWRVLLVTPHVVSPGD
jgi:hypothetical protein